MCIDITIADLDDLFVTIATTVIEGLVSGLNCALQEI